MYSAGFIRRALSALLAAAGVILITAVPAAAARQWQTVFSTSATYTDDHSPNRTFPVTADAPVGAWADEQGAVHSSKAYYTVDLTAFRDATFFSATAWAPETEVTDCTKPIATELWLTADAAEPTWTEQPAELVRHQASTTPGCPWSRVEWDVKKTLTDAVAAGRTKLTFVLRMPNRQQFDKQSGRRYGKALGITMNYNRPPAQATSLQVKGANCGDAPLLLGDHDIWLSAAVTDPDGTSWLGARFAVWNVADPAKRYEANAFGSDRPRVDLPASFLQDGQTYEWTAQADDGDAVGPVSTPCRFATDYTAPQTAPKVSSSLYPEHSGPPGTGGPKVAGEFVFDAQGDTDVVRFEWWSSTGVMGSADADQPGGKAKVMIEPGISGRYILSAVALDRVGNRSPEATYDFWVADAPSTGPVVTAQPDKPLLGAPFDLVFSPRMADVTEYTYRINNGVENTVPATADGTARVTLTATEFTSVAVWSKSRDGSTSDRTLATFDTQSSRPDVVRDGDVFTFTAHLYQPTEFVYEVDDGGQHRVPVGPDGTATVTIPSDPGWHYITVFTLNSAGVRSDDADEQWVTPTG